MNSDTNRDDQDETIDDAVIAKAFKNSRLIIGLIAIPFVAVVIYFAMQAAEEKKFVAEASIPQMRLATEIAIPKILLHDITEASGISFVHQSGRTGEKLLPETMGSGVAVFDANGDDHLNLFFPDSTVWPWDDLDEKRPQGGLAHSQTSMLYLGDGAGGFTDATEAAVLGLKIYAMGAAVGDFDNDGDSDLFVSAVGQNRLFRNDTTSPASPSFTDQGDVGNDTESWSTSCGFVDYDNDSLLDLFVCNYVTWDRETDLGQSFTLDGKSRAYGPPRAFAGSFPTLYHNEGDGRFVDVSEAAGI